ncbi:MAG: SUKH-3 domain-containing protein [Oscillospiraceae bacterium]|nr:SUKH-3 domain-containing protein [Oscillospiraceae bacterium]
MLNKVAKRQLEKAGWYEGRKIDIYDQIEFWESLGYQTFDAAIRFMEEFGKLHIIEKFISDFNQEICVRKHTTFVTEILEFYNEYTEQDKFEFNQMGMCKEKILPVVQFDEEYVIFIGESGAFYCDAGLKAESSEVLWNERYSTEYGSALPWDKIGTGEQRKRYVKSSMRKYL